MRPPAFVAFNLFLALVPVILGFAVTAGIRRQVRTTGRVTWALWLPLLLVWLVFLPNTCYLLTEWRHYLEYVATTPLYWQARAGRDGLLNLLQVTAFYILYSGTGLLTFFLAIWPLDRLTRRRLGPWVWVVRPLVFVLSALGVYLGLMVLRFNSWDLAHPDRVRALLAVIAATPLRPALVAVILAFGAFLWAAYALFDIWMDGATWRLHLRRMHPPEASVPKESAWPAAPRPAASRPRR